MLRQYIGLIRKDTNSDYGVNFPDFPGCVTAGRTLDEALAMSAEALALHIEGLAGDGEAVPEASSLEAVMADPDNRDGVAILVPVASPVAKTMRVNITLPEDVLNAIDHYSENHGLTRSGFLVKAAKDSMNLEDA
jgi:predicted RNase H-like HicB family nuclease